MIIVGLGNPGEKFKGTRHNAGFMAVDKFAGKYNFPGFSLSKKFEAEISEKDDLILAKPQTFMNNSGRAVKKLLDFHKKQELIVVNDDMDLPFGHIRVVKNRGSAGQKGVESIIKELGTEDFIRIRIGILPETGKPAHTEQFVLTKIKDQKMLENVLDKACSAIDTIAKYGLEPAMNEYNK